MIFIIVSDLAPAAIGEVLAGQVSSPVQKEMRDHGGYCTVRAPCHVNRNPTIRQRPPTNIQCDNTVVRSISALDHLPQLRPSF